MNSPSVTVVMPTYNRAHLIAPTIDAVLQQTHKNTELVVVDDGSTDETQSVIAHRYGGNPQVRHVYKPNGGVSSARNIGLEHASGDYVAFLDSDDLWKPWKLALQVAVLDKLSSQKVGMLWTNLDSVDAGGNPIKASCMRDSYSTYALFQQYGLDIFENSAALTTLLPGIEDPGQGTTVYWGDVYSRMLMGNLCQPSTVMLTRERARDIGGFDESMVSGEDHAYHLKASRAGPAALLDAASVVYRKGASDQLTQPRYTHMIASNYLNTILPAIERDRERLDLPPAMLKQVIAGAYEWVAMESWYQQDYVGARRNFSASLRHQPAQWRQWLMLALTIAPPKLVDALRNFRRSATGQ